MKHGAGVLLIQDGKVMLVRAGAKSKQLDGQISFPGGTMEEGETEMQTAIREFTEETGLIAKNLIDFPGNYVEDNIVVKMGSIDFSFKVFLAREYSGALSGTEETEPFWADLQEARSMSLLGKNNEILENAIKFLKL